MKKRCEWGTNSELMIRYHDKEWGVPLYRDRKIFEFILLDAFQAGLSWSTIINKRENFKKAFDNFDIKKIAKYDERKIKKLMGDKGIIRNRQKINATVENAKQFLKVKKEFGTFRKYIWQFVGHKPKQNKWKTLKQIPAKTKVSDRMSEDLKSKGFEFVGSTICYAFMQASGMVNDHLIYCFRYKKVGESNGKR